MPHPALVAHGVVTPRVLAVASSVLLFLGVLLQFLLPGAPPFSFFGDEYECADPAQAFVDVLLLCCLPSSAVTRLQRSLHSLSTDRHLLIWPSGPLHVLSLRAPV